MLSTAPNATPSVQQQVWTIMCGLVHDLRQPLSVIEACADYLDLVVPAGNTPAHRQLELLQQQVAEASRLMQDVLMQMNGGEVRRKPVASASVSAAFGGKHAVAAGG
jgi:hypothetical protein